MALTWIYLMRDLDTGYYKIGKSVDPSARLKQLMKQDTKQPTPNNFKLLEAWWSDERSEKDLHRKFWSKNRRGEWFDLDDADLAILIRFFELNQPYTVTVRSNNFAAELREARSTIQRLEYDLKTAQSQLRNVMQITALDTAKREAAQAEIDKKSMAEAEAELQRRYSNTRTVRQVSERMRDLPSLKKWRNEHGKTA